MVFLEAVQILHKHPCIIVIAASENPIRPFDPRHAAFGPARLVAVESGTVDAKHVRLAQDQTDMHGNLSQSLVEAAVELSTLVHVLLDALAQVVCDTDVNHFVIQAEEVSDKGVHKRLACENFGSSTTTALQPLDVHVSVIEESGASRTLDAECLHC
jgi:hypothetical protein